MHINIDQAGILGRNMTQVYFVECQFYTKLLRKHRLKEVIGKHQNATTSEEEISISDLESQRASQVGRQVGRQVGFHSSEDINSSRMEVARGQSVKGFLLVRSGGVPRPQPPARHFSSTPPFNFHKENLTVACSLDLHSLGTSVTRCLDYESIFGHLQQ